jgi:hypothetical protein
MQDLLVARTVSAALVAAAILLPLVAFAQAGPQPSAPSQTPEAQMSGVPANLCQELVAFVHQPDPSRGSDAPPPQLATAVSAKKNDAPSAKPGDAAGAAQQASGQSGQITSSGPGATGPQGIAQNEAAPAGTTATAAGPPKAASSANSTASSATDAHKPTPENVQQVEAAAASNDLLGCRTAAQKMRRAGVVMPGPLLALSALDPKLLERARR